MLRDRMRKIKELKNKLLLTLIYLLFLFIYWYFDLSCIFRYFFNIPCPGCGMVHAVSSILKLDFVLAFKYHPMFWSVPVLYLYMLYDGKIFNNKFIDNSILILIALGFFANWIIRLFW